MSWVIVLTIAAVGLALSALYSGAETGLYCVSRLRLHLAVKWAEPRALRVARALEDRQAALSMTLIGTNVTNYVTTTAVAFLFAELLGLSETDTEIYTIVMLTPIVFVFAEVVPKTLFQRYPYTLLMRSSLWLWGTYRFLQLFGVLWCQRRLANLVTRLAQTDPKRRGTFEPKRRMAVLLHEALAGQTLGDDRSYLIEQVMQLPETPLHAVMIPRNRVITISGRADRRELARIARRTDHTRLPVYDTGPRHIVGLVSIDELLRSQTWDSVGDRLEPVATMSPHVTVAAAMSHMQGTGRDMVVVTDRGGQMLGVVTLEDLLDMVLGELAAGV